MANAKEIKGRIHSIKNTQKTTKAMELVAGAKMRKAVHSALHTRAYHRIAWNIVDNLRKEKDFDAQKKIIRFFQKTSGRKFKRTTVLMFTSNRGLCGAFNSNIVKKVFQFVQENGKENTEIVGIGKKGVAQLSAYGVKAERAYQKDDSAITDESIREISAQIYKEFAEGKINRVMVAYTDYQSAIVQTARLIQLYPISEESRLDLSEDEAPSSISEQKQVASNLYIYEPNGLRVLQYLIPRIAEVELYQALLESNASEHSARMVAMKSATDAAGDMAKELKLAYNRARQAAITKEIAEISAGTAAVT